MIDHAATDFLSHSTISTSVKWAVATTIQSSTLKVTPAA